MQDFDRITIQVLKDIDLPVEKYKNLNEFPNDIIIISIIKCLLKIDPSFNISLDIPQNISEKYKICNCLVKNLNALGYTEKLFGESLLYKQIDQIRPIFMFLFDKFPTEKSVEKHNIKKDVASHIAHVFYKNLSMPYFPYYKWKGKPFCVRSYMIVLPNKNSKLYTLKNYDKIKFESLIHQTNNNQSLFNSLIDWNFSRLYMEKNKITKTINLTETSFEVGSQIQPTRTASDSFSDEEEHFYDIPTSLEDHVAEDIYIVEDELQISEQRKNIAILTSIKESMRNSQDSLKTTMDQHLTKRDDLLLVVEKLKIMPNLIENKEKYVKLNSNIDTVRLKLDIDEKAFFEMKAQLEDKISQLKENKIKMTHETDRLNSELEQMEIDLSSLTLISTKLSTEINELERTHSSKINRKYLTDKLVETAEYIRTQTEKISQLLHRINDVNSQICIISIDLEERYQKCHNIIVEGSNIDLFSRNSYIMISGCIKCFDDYILIIKKQNSIIRSTKDLIKKTEECNQIELDKNIATIQQDLETL